MVCMCYGSPLGTFGEQSCSRNAPNRTLMHLGAFGECLCSPNKPNTLTYHNQTINMVHMHYGSALGTFAEQRLSPNTLNCTPMHLGAIGEGLCPPNVPNALP